MDRALDRQLAGPACAASERPLQLHTSSEEQVQFGRKKSELGCY